MENREEEKRRPISLTERGKKGYDFLKSKCNVSRRVPRGFLFHPL